MIFETKRFAAPFTGFVASVLLATIPSSAAASDRLSAQDLMGDLPEIKRLRHFSEVRAIDALASSELTGQGVRVTIMGEMVDPDHADLSHAVRAQYNTALVRGAVQNGEGQLPVGSELLDRGMGHGTHIAGTIAAACDGVGIQGLACNAQLDVYDILTYGQIDSSALVGWGDEANQFTVLLGAFAIALDDVTRRGDSKIVTGSFNLESPAIQFSEASALNGKPVSAIIDVIDGEAENISDIFDKGFAVPEDTADQAFLERVIEANEGDESIALLSLLPLSSEWSAMEQAVAQYQASGGVYIVTESNYRFENRTSTLNALPSMSQIVDPDLWLSVVMVAPENAEETAATMSPEAFERWLATEAVYSTPLNSCGEAAADYCMVTPSYGVLSTMTERVAEADLRIFELDERTYQVFTGHSMGAPMVAAALALMEEKNRRSNLGYSMKDLVQILKSSARKDFPGYARKFHGAGMLDIGAALTAMKE